MQERRRGRSDRGHRRATSPGRPRRAPGPDPAARSRRPLAARGAGARRGLPEPRTPGAGAGAAAARRGAALGLPARTPAERPASRPDRATRRREDRERRFLEGLLTATRFDRAVPDNKDRILGA